MESFWKLSGHRELLEAIWSLRITGSGHWRVTGSFLVIGSYWKFSGHLELLGVFWIWSLFIGSYWKLSGH